MADKGTAVLLQGARLGAQLPIQGRPIPETNYGSATVFGSAGWEPPPRPPGDYASRLAAVVLPGVRSTVFRARLDGVTTVRHMSLVNTSASARNVTVWLGGVIIVPSVSVRAGKGIGQDVGMWILNPGERLEAQVDGGGVNMFVFGVEEVFG